MDFNKLRKNANKAEGNSSSFSTTDKKHLTRKDRKEIQIYKPYWMRIRKAVFNNPGTTYTQWADRCLRYAIQHGVLNQSDK